LADRSELAGIIQNIKRPRCVQAIVLLDDTLAVTPYLGVSSWLVRTSLLYQPPKRFGPAWLNRDVSESRRVERVLNNLQSPIQLGQVGILRISRIHRVQSERGTDLYSYF
jgi:hypothetical protein